VLEEEIDAGGYGARVYSVTDAGGVASSSPPGLRKVLC